MNNWICIDCGKHHEGVSSNIYTDSRPPKKCNCGCKWFSDIASMKENELINMQDDVLEEERNF